MADITLETLKAEISALPEYKDLDLKTWDKKIKDFGMDKRQQVDFDAWEKMYPRKIEAIRKELAGPIVVPVHEGMTKEDYAKAVVDREAYLIEKESRLFDMLACCLEEQKLRTDKLVTRTDTHKYEYYYIDYTGGSDSADGRRFPTDVAGSGANATMDAGSNTTTIVDAALDGLTITAGDYIYNVTRGLSDTVATWTDATDTIALTGSIASQTTGDEYFLIRAWKNVITFAEGARSAGDRGYMRANVVWTQGTEADNITFLSDGSAALYIRLIGCDDTASGVDPWEDNSDVRPIIDFEDATYNCQLSADWFWYFDNIQFKQSASSPTMYLVASKGVYFKSCKFSDSANAGGRLVQATESPVTVENCEFIDAKARSLMLTTGAVAIIKNTTFSAGADVSTDCALWLETGSRAYISDSTVDGTHDVDEFYARTGSEIFCRNVTFGAAGNTIYNASGGYEGIYSEDDDATFESHITQKYSGTITSGTTSPRPGGADSFAIMTPASNCELSDPLVLGDPMSGFAKIWMAADAASTITVYARVVSAWDVALTASTCYLTASYLDSESDAGRTVLQSTETITNDVAWTAFSVTIPASNPQKTGWVYLWFNLAAYDAAEAIDVDILPVIS